MGEYFSHNEVFPAISQSIRVIHDQKHDFVTQPELVESLIGLPSLHRVISDARRRKGQTAEYWAANMIAWFGQKITVGESIYEGEFTRKKIGGKWAYKPR